MWKIGSASVVSDGGAHYRNENSRYFHRRTPQVSVSLALRFYTKGGRREISTWGDSLMTTFGERQAPRALAQFFFEKIRNDLLVGVIRKLSEVEDDEEGCTEFSDQINKLAIGDANPKCNRGDSDFILVKILGWLDIHVARPLPENSFPQTSIPGSQFYVGIRAYAQRFIEIGAME